MMMDVDYFKSINDVYGHLFGDLVLKQLARQLKRMVRQYDIVIRFGGEEFVIISPGIDRPKSIKLAERILDAITLYNFGNKEHSVKLKLSIAVASYPEEKITKGMDLVEISDKVLDKVKECGGNNVCSSLDIKKKARPSKGKLKIDVGMLRDKIQKLTKRTNESLIEAVFAFAKTIELKDQYTGEHVEKTVQYATEIARELNLPSEEIERIKQAAVLHDLGKIGISEKILVKPAKLTKEEFDEIKKHPQIGVDIIRPIKFLHSIIPIILSHHERWDGKGYPHGLKKEEIPIGARVVAIADVYQALTSNRPYRKAYSQEEALKIIKQGAGTQFDPDVVTKFLRIIQQKKD
jgi:diguanylate cyclase (GGDEF)-like protein/putative nucleotidyltransferase with HDIG domain